MKNKEILKKLDEVIQVITLENSSFAFNNEEKNKEIKEAIKPWLWAWVEEPLKSIRKEVQKEVDKYEARKNNSVHQTSHKR